MATYARIFVLVDVAHVYEEFTQTLDAVRLGIRAARDPARKRGLQATEKEIQAVLLQYSRGLDSLALKSSKLAEKSMKSAFDATKSRTRGRTGKKPGLRSKLDARPLRLPGLSGGTGMVGVANVNSLNKLTNEFSPGYGTYWRAQEFGTGTNEVPSQVGRVIQGFFVGAGGGGDPERPNAAYRGGGGPHPIFISAKSQRAVFSAAGFAGRGAGQRGGVGGLGTIGREIQGRHFIRDGANRARDVWQAEIRSNENRALTALGAIAGLSAAQNKTATLLGRRR